MLKTMLLREWLIDYITDTIHGMKAENSPEFDLWAASFKREEAEFVVNMEYLVECGDELREEMKENGIGRPSTRAAIIEKLYQRKYIVKQGKSLRATETGINLIHLIVSPLLKSAFITLPSNVPFKPMPL